MKYFRMSYDEVLYKRSYINLILLNRAIPGVKPYKENGSDDDSIEMPEFETGQTVTYEEALSYCDEQGNGNKFLMSLM